MCGFYYTMHAFLPGPVHVGQSAGKAAFRSSSPVRLFRHTGQLTGPSTPNPPNPPPPIMGAGGLLTFHGRSRSLPLFPLYRRLAPEPGRSYNCPCRLYQCRRRVLAAQPTQQVLLPEAGCQAARPRGMPASRVRFVLRKKNFTWGQFIGDIPVLKGIPELQQVCPLSY
jgi:hypothetical protein